MRRFFTYMAFFTAVLLAGASCTFRTMVPDETDGRYIELSVSATDLEITKAEKDGVNNLNENLIRSIDYFIYKSNRAEGDPAFIHGRFEESETKQNSETIRVNVDEKTFNNTIMPSPADTCAVYVIVNRPSGCTLPEITSIENLRKCMVEMDVTTYPQGSFVMDGIGKVTITPSNEGGRMAKTIASGTIKAERLAAKHTLAIFVNDSYADNNGNTWYTQPEEMRVLLVNAVQNSALSGKFSDNENPTVFGFNEDNLLEYGRSCAKKVLDGKTYYEPNPFYSYSSKWEFNSDTEPYYLVELPVSDGTLFKKCYYKVLLKGNSLDRNTWNHINLTLGVLGSFSRETPTVTVSYTAYFVFDWRDALKQQEGGSDHDVEAAIRDVRYIMVSEPDRTIDNIGAMVIDFNSSHPCEIVSASAWTTKFNSETGKFERYNVDAATVQAWFAVDNINHTLEFSHELNNDINDSNLDIFPYNITINIAHTDDQTFSETITIVQNPAIIVTPTDTMGDVFVNGQERNSTPARYNTVASKTGTEYMYVIETKVVPNGKNYIITDPRSTTPNKITAPMIDDSARAGQTYDIFDYSNSNVNPSDQKLYVDNLPGLSNAPALFVEGDDHYVENGTDTRKMRYYYPTLTTQESEQFIAPKFRISSRFNSMSGVGPTWYDIVRRCATYQEAGYPAGRWRLPTLSEVIYVISLQNLGLVPDLFTPGDGYYCATNSLSYSTSDRVVSITNEISNAHSLRCVYDDWYWEQTDKKVNGKVNGSTLETMGGRLPMDKYAQFTWGDMPRKDSDPIPTATKLSMNTVNCTAKGKDYLTFSWNTVEHALGYEISTDNINFESVGTNTSYTWDGLSEDTSCTLYVRASGDGYFYSTSDASYCQAKTLKKVKKILWENPGYGSVTNSYLHSTNQPAYRFASPNSVSSGDCIYQFDWDEWQIIKGQTLYVEIGSSSFSFQIMTGHWDGNGEQRATFTENNGNATRVNNDTYYIVVNLYDYNRTVYDNLDQHDLCFYGTNVKVNSIYYYTYE